MLGWTCMAWAVLRLPNSAGAFFLIVGAFLLIHLILPSGRALLNVPKGLQQAGPPSPAAASTTAALLLLMTAAIAPASTQAATASPSAIRTAQREPAIAESVIQAIRVDETFASKIASAKERLADLRAAYRGKVAPL